jgi:glutamate--cysteine ligase catalytic subunit
VTYKDDDEKVTLSLRQADILIALAEDEKLCSHGGVVPALQDINASECVFCLGGGIQLTL